MQPTPHIPASSGPGLPNADPSIAALPSCPRGHAFDLAITPPGSKSLTNRALLLAALANGVSTLVNPLIDADDTQHMIAALRELGAIISPTSEGLSITGVNGRWPTPLHPAHVNAHASGTTARFLLGAALFGSAPITIDGTPRLRERPITELCDALSRMGARIEHLAAPARLPVRLTPPAQLPRACVLEVGPVPSSQFISSLLMLGPWLPAGITLRVVGAVTSGSYIAMTAGLLSHLGARVQTSENLRVLRVAPAPGKHGLPAFHYRVEPDASSATYFAAAAAICEGSCIRIQGLGPTSLQGDAKFPELLARMGASVAYATDPEPFTLVRAGPGPSPTLTPILADMADMPDAALTLAAVACFADGTSIIRGVRSLRLKESDRIDALRTQFAKLGVQVISPVQGDDDAMTITPPEGGIDQSPDAPPITLDPSDDHRVAMSLAVIALRRPNLTLLNPGCVAKTYPDFWRDWSLLFTPTPT